MDSKTQEKYESQCDEIHKLIGQLGEPLEGNCYTYHMSLVKAPELFNKQTNLYTLAFPLQFLGGGKICEIGFNAGHSSLLFILGAKTPQLLLFDLGDHSYMRQCYDWMKKQFPFLKMEMVEGDSRYTMAEFLTSRPSEVETFDIVHVDGGHQPDVVQSDIGNALKLLKVGGVLILDDTNIPHIDAMGDDLVKRGTVVERHGYPTQLYKHRIFTKVK